MDDMPCPMAIFKSIWVSRSDLSLRHNLCQLLQPVFPQGRHLRKEDMVVLKVLPLQASTKLRYSRIILPREHLHLWDLHLHLDLPLPVVHPACLPDSSLRTLLEDDEIFRDPNENVTSADTKGFDAIRSKLKVLLRGA